MCWYRPAFMLFAFPGGISTYVLLLLYYLDNFLFIGAPGTNEASRAAWLATDTFCSLGVPVAFHKTEGPSLRIIFLGIVVDTSLCQLRLLEEKLQRLQVMMSEWQARRSAPARSWSACLATSHMLLG